MGALGSADDRLVGPRAGEEPIADAIAFLGREHGPPLVGTSGEREVPEAFLDPYRDILRRKLTGLSDEQIPRHAAW